MKKQIDPNKPKVKIPSGKSYLRTKNTVETYKLHTICQSGKCPNIRECWGAGTATFMILGEICTRSCKFCSVISGKPLPVDIHEPQRVAEAIKIMNLKHAVVTSVDRDDLPDYGAQHWKNTILAIKNINPNTTLEVLIPDFMGQESLLDLIIQAKPDIVSHNLETVKRLTPFVRSVAKYERSLNVLKYLANNGMKTKSGIMVGLGETFEEIVQTIDDLYLAGCRILTVGQYLQPTANNLRVEKYYSSDEFIAIKEIALNKGFEHVESSSLVRSSYHSEKHV